METDNYSLRGIVNSVVTGACLVALACGFQAAFSPTVRITCPARTSTAPDCDMRWLAAFDRITVRHVPLPGVSAVSEIVRTAAARKGGATTLYVETTAGRVRTILWGGHPVELQGLRDPMRAYLADPAAPALVLTMWPSEAPIRPIANTIAAIGAIFWLCIPVQLVVMLGRRLRS